MSRTKPSGGLLAVGLSLAVAIAIAACQGAGASPTIDLPSELPTTLPSELESLLPSEMPSGAPGPAAVVVFRDVHGGDIAGGAAVIDLDGQTVVAIALASAQMPETLSARIVEGTCADVTDQTPAVASLSDLAIGSGSTVLPMPPDTFTSSAHAVVILEPAAVPSAEPGASAAPSVEASPAPSTSAEMASPSIDTRPIGEVGQLVACGDIVAPGTTPPSPAASPEASIGTGPSPETSAEVSPAGS